MTIAAVKGEEGEEGEEGEVRVDEVIALILGVGWGGEKGK